MSCKHDCHNQINLTLTKILDNVMNLRYNFTRNLVIKYLDVNDSTSACHNELSNYCNFKSTIIIPVDQQISWKVQIEFRCIIKKSINNFNQKSFTSEECWI
jgi:hypothetical protein